MGVEDVNTNQRHELEEHYPGVECDIATAKIHHEMNPSANYIMAEFKFPTIKRQMPEEDYNRIADTYHYDCMHRMKYIKVDNNTFHRFMNNEGKQRPQTNRSNGETTDQYYSYREREGIDVVRDTLDGKVITHYNSNVRPLGLLRHDYYMGQLLYANWPARDYIRRIPCKKLDPECIECPDTMKAYVNGWIDDAPPYKPVIEKTFFTYIAENHRLCMGYTVDLIASGDTCYEPTEPEYYILDMSVLYFEEAIYVKKDWENSILFNRKNNNEEMYSWGGTIKNNSGDHLPFESDAWQDYKSPLPLVKYNPTQVDTVPKDIWLALSTGDFTALWEADLIRYNARNSAHKYSFSSWVKVGTFQEHGWFCGWNTSEVISSHTAGHGAAGQAVKGQLTQVANMFGWNDGAGGSTDSIFTLISPKLPGHEYEQIVEPLPVRDI